MIQKFEDWELNGKRFRVEATLHHDGTYGWSGFRDEDGIMMRIPMATRAQENSYPRHVAKRGHELVLRLNAELGIVGGQVPPVEKQLSLLDV